MVLVLATCSFTERSRASTSREGCSISGSGISEILTSK
jgi:hypothetical protein